MAGEESNVKDNLDKSSEDATLVKAKAQGWSEKEHWKGDPDAWVDAETFVKRGEDWLGGLKKSNEALSRDLNLTKQQLKDLRATTEEFKKFQKEAYDRKAADLESQLSTLKAERAKAITDGDGTRVNTLDEEMDKTKEGIKEAKASSVEAAKPTKEPVQAPPTDPVMQDWLETNTWFGTDKRMTAITNGIGESLRLEFPNLTGKDFLKKMDEVLEEEFPNRFGKTKERKGPAVESGSGTRGGGGSRNAKSYENLPSDAKAACDRYVASKLMTKEQYIADYDWS